MTTPVIPAIERTHVAQACHPSYEGECVPITSDAECAGGSGNAPHTSMAAFAWSGQMSTGWIEMVTGLPVRGERREVHKVRTLLTAGKTVAPPAAIVCCAQAGITWYACIF
jgi:hypothetical protein